MLHGFNEYRMLILKELERADERLSSIEEKRLATIEALLVSIQKDIVILQVKSGIWGAIGGGIIGLLTALGTFLLSK